MALEPSVATYPTPRTVSKGCFLKPQRCRPYKCRSVNKHSCERGWLKPAMGGGGGGGGGVTLREPDLAIREVPGLVANSLCFYAWALASSEVNL